jgi:hypothetical protein
VRVATAQRRHWEQSAGVRPHNACVRTRVLLQKFYTPVWRLACWLGAVRDCVGLTAASRSLRAACLLWSFSTARAHTDAFAAGAISLGCLLLSFVVSGGSAARCDRTLMAPAWGRVIASVVEIGSAPNPSRCASYGQAGHLKICRSMEGAQRKASPTITCIRRISAPHARHCMTATPQSPAYRALRQHMLATKQGGLSAAEGNQMSSSGLLPGAAIERKEAVSRAPSEARVRGRKTNPVSLAVFLKWRVIQLARNRNRKEDSSD